MSDVTATWDATTTGTPTSYLIQWTQNGTALPPVSVPVTAAQNAAGYSLDFDTSEPTFALSVGDVIGATGQAIDAVNSLSGPVTVFVPPTVVIPAGAVAPGALQNPVLTLS